MSTLVLRPRRLGRRAAAVGSLILLMIGAVLIDIAGAHGSAINPASRNYGCLERWADDFQNPRMATEDPMCWQAWQADPNAMWNWNGLYREGVAGNHQAAVPDGKLCSGGNTASGRYDALDVPGAWRATNVTNDFTWTMHDAAKHGADYIRIYVTKQGFDPLTQRLRWSDLELRRDTGRILPGVGQPSNDPDLTGVNISAPVSAPGRTGRHMVFAVWQASHSDQSYYLCSDVIFGDGGGDPSPTATPTATPTVTPTATPTEEPTEEPGGACTAAYTVTSQWSGGFQAEVRVTAGAAPISGWTVRWTYPGGQTLSSAWNADATSSGSTVTARNVSWNGRVAAGASTTVGLLGTSSGAPTSPTLTCTAS